MQQAAIALTEASYQSIKAANEEFPWFMVKQDNQRVHYRYDWLTEFFGESNTKKQDGLGLTFVYPKYIKPGTELNIGIPLPDSTQDFKANVVVSTEKDDEYEIGIWLHTDSDADLELLLKSCEYASN